MTHRSEAVANLRLAEHDPSPDGLLLAAQVEALLEIAEQLRVGNDLRRVQIHLASGYDFAKELFESTGHTYLDATSLVFKREIADLIHIDGDDQ